jgi:hypothetical protein
MVLKAVLKLKLILQLIRGLILIILLILMTRKSLILLGTKMTSLIWIWTNRAN